MDPNIFIGKRIGEYQVIKILGRGGYGVVYEAIDNNQRRVALKIPTTPAKNPDLIEEAEILLTLEKICPDKTPTLIDSFFIESPDKNIEEDLYVVVMELIKGRDLFTYIQRNEHKLSTHVRVSLVLQVLRDIVPILECLSRNGYVHNDIKLENIMVEGHGRNITMSLIDFGIWCKLLPQNSPECSSITKRCCQRQGVRGSLYYVSPEEVDYGRSFATSDVWALGTVCYKILHDAYPSNIQLKGKITIEFYDKPPGGLVNYGKSNQKDLVRMVNSLINSMLIPDTDKRITLEGISQWIHRNSVAINNYIQRTTTSLPKEIDLMLPPDINFAILSNMAEDVNISFGDTSFQSQNISFGMDIDTDDWTAYLDKWFLEYPVLQRYNAGQTIYDFLDREMDKYYKGIDTNITPKYLKYEKGEKTVYDSDLLS